MVRILYFDLDPKFEVQPPVSTPISSGTEFPVAANHHYIPLAAISVVTAD